MIDLTDERRSVCANERDKTLKYIAPSLLAIMQTT